MKRSINLNAIGSLNLSVYDFMYYHICYQFNNIVDHIGISIGLVSIKLNTNYYIFLFIAALSLTSHTQLCWNTKTAFGRNKNALCTQCHSLRIKRCVNNVFMTGCVAVAVAAVFFLFILLYFVNLKNEKMQ